LPSSLPTSLPTSLPAPLPTSLPDSLPSAPTYPLPKGAFLFLEGEAQAQTSFKTGTARTISPTKTTLPVVSLKTQMIYKGILPVKTKTAPLLLARALTFRLGTVPYVLQSPFQIVAAQFSAIPAADYRFVLRRIARCSNGPSAMNTGTGGTKRSATGRHPEPRSTAMV
jgi:hypothetical protein